MKAFSIDFIRQLISQTLLEENIKQPTKYIGNENQVRLTSFYEHLASDDEVNRFVETVRDLTEQQNRTGLIANGIIFTPENPTITNVNKATIIPLSFTMNFRCKLADRDLVLETLNNAVSILKGRKWDIAEFDNGKLFKVGTIANNVDGQPLIRNGDFIGGGIVDEDEYFDNSVKYFLNIYANKGVSWIQGIYSQRYFYYLGQDSNGLYTQLKVGVGNYNSDTNQWTYSRAILETEQYPNVIFPPQHNSFTKWCVSMSFDSFKCSEPRTLNANDYCDISFGGSATICSSNVVLGNQLTKVGILRDKIKTSDNGSTDYDFNETSYNWLEPLELPSGNNPDTQVNSLLKNNFLNNSHTNSINITNEYTFICDDEDNFLNMLFKYGRYGIQRENNEYTITPNTIFKVKEIWSKWGVVNVHEYSAKISGSVDIENTESDTLTITLPLQTQGEYN